MLCAAKEETAALPVIWGESVLPLAADPALLENRIWGKSLVAENSRQGFELRSSSLRWASSEVKSRTALGMRGVLYDEGIRSRCTGKERDSESGLDNFGARYNASSMGRFMTPDPLHIMKQKLLDPQQWNMYSYVRNNPLRFIDPTGMYDVDCKSGDKKCNKAADNFEKQRQKDLKSKDQKVRDAAKAWGDRGEHNHVGVTFKPQAEVDRDANTQAGYTTQGFVRTIGAKGDDDAHIQAEFSESLGGSSLGQTIAHEGSHIEDDMTFLNSYDPSTGKYNSNLNFTHFDTEFQAFEAGSGVKSYAEFPKGPRGYQKLEDYIYQAYPNANDLVFLPYDPATGRGYPQ